MFTKLDVYNRLLNYLENDFSFNFLDEIPATDKTYIEQKAAILRLVSKNEDNEAFLKNIDITLNLIETNIVSDIIALRWEKSNNVTVNIIDDDKLSLQGDGDSYHIILLLIIRDILHSLPVAALPIFNEYKYNVVDFREDVRSTINFAVDTIVASESDLSPLCVSLSAKSILPYSKSADDISSISRLVNILFHLSKIMSSYTHYNNEESNTKSLFISSINNLINNAYFFGLDVDMLKKIYKRALNGEISWNK
jgi:hypothetical protein